MIKIEAIIKPEKANSIGLALEEAGVGGYFLSNITGKGNQKAVITTVVDDSQKQKVLDIVLEYAKTGDGEIGDGKIFITKVEEVIRVRTNETGKEAL